MTIDFEEQEKVLRETRPLRTVMNGDRRSERSVVEGTHYTEEERERIRRDPVQAENDAAGRIRSLRVQRAVRTQLHRMGHVVRVSGVQTMRCGVLGTCAALTAAALWKAFQGIQTGDMVQWSIAAGAAVVGALLTRKQWTTILWRNR